MESPPVSVHMMLLSSVLLVSASYVFLLLGAYMFLSYTLERVKLLSVYNIHLCSCNLFDLKSILSDSVNNVVTPLSFGFSLR